MLANLTGEQFGRVLTPKMTGAWLLSRATRELDLDFFVLFSSVLSLWGGLGQAAYTAANSFLDALAATRRSAGLPATVFHWGPWADVGLDERWGRAGRVTVEAAGHVAAVSPRSASMSSSDSSTGSDPRSPCATRVWPEFLAQFSDASPLLPRAGTRRSRNAIAEVAPDETPERRVEIVRSHVGQVLGVDGDIPVSQPLNELGLDSLLAVNLANPAPASPAGARSRRRCS